MPKQLTNRREVLESGSEPALSWGHAEQPDLGRLEVNVIFTDPQTTALALRAAMTLAAQLDACIRLRAAIVVPLQLPIEEPQISIPFMQNVLSELVSHLEPQGLDVTAHLYLSRDRAQTFLDLLEPNSVVIVAGRKRPWGTSESRLAKHLQRQGHRVLFIPWTKRHAAAVSNGTGAATPVSSHQVDSFRLGAS